MTFRSSPPAFRHSTPGCAARQNEARGGARTYVACDGHRVAGFYSLAASSVKQRQLSFRVGRNMPDPIRVILLGQLAVDEDYRGLGLGTDLLVDAGPPCGRAVVVQAIDEGRRRSTSGSATVRSPITSRS
ncbi:MAG: GNAT family N-acetyltransferase [Rhodospirillaceae bacterium]|nr:GNAT family N-acetyltransferase [Rhodospirillaceae bacterium]